MHAGDNYCHIHAFNAEKSDVNVEGEGNVVYEFFYDGDCGFTWTLSRVRINGRNTELRI
jgi:hypothetical protein